MFPPRFFITSPFTESPVLNQYACIANDSQASRQLHQISQQSQAGCKFLSGLLKQLEAGNYSILNIIPIPLVIRFEDGYEFRLHENSYISEDDLEYSLTEILSLLTLSPEERDDNITPQFDILAWSSPSCFENSRVVDK